MDSRERDQRGLDGFSERGDILYDAGENDERNEFRKKRTRQRKEKDIKEYDPSDGEVRERTPDDVNGDVSRKAQNANEYGLDDEEAEDIKELSEEEEDIFEEEDEH